MHVSKALYTAMLVSCLALGVMADTAKAQVVAGPGQNTGPSTTFTVTRDPGTSGEFHFGSPNNRTTVQHSAGAGSFEKQLALGSDENQDGVINLLDLDIFLANFGSPLVLNEHLRVGPNDPWTGWDEKLLTPGWKWGAVSLTTPSNPGVLANLTTNVTATNAGFSFAPLPVGTDVLIRKELIPTTMFTAQDSTDFLNGTYLIRVAEYPTAVPEPSGVVAVIIGLASLGTPKRRR